MTTRATPIRIGTVAPLAGYVLRLGVSDRTTRGVDLESELWGSVFEPLRDPALFRQVAVHHELGAIVWPYGADMDAGVLRRGHAAA